ncbi:hypothetical protein [Xanthomonas graminis]|jgi:hypothetical protein|uniref:hypothetical protein n=1 Tax=Xanthomonas graminis TaxID=3390026 RepID=UPI001E4FD2EF|nr:hypothetical protein [Xanthomonas translucens]
MSLVPYMTTACVAYLASVALRASASASVLVLPFTAMFMSPIWLASASIESRIALDIQPRPATRVALPASPVP